MKEGFDLGALLEIGKIIYLQNVQEFLLKPSGHFARVRVLGSMAFVKNSFTMNILKFN